MHLDIYIALFLYLFLLFWNRFAKFLPSIMDLRKEFEWMKTKLKELNSPLGFCHNDLLLANILYDQEKHSIHFIDFEYAGPNYLAYDIANHFCEFAGTTFRD